MSHTLGDVVNLSKIQKMKAIHNCRLSHPAPRSDVVNLSKIQKMKAIHNGLTLSNARSHDVVNLSKIQKMKAIHNRRSTKTQLLRYHVVQRRD